MSITSTETQLPQYVRVTVTGAPTLRELLMLVDRIAERSRKWETRRLLVDLSLVRDVPDPMAQALIGDHVGTEWSHLRVASVVPADKITRNSERAAHRRGAVFQVFSEEYAALAWLLAAPDRG